MKLLFLSRYQNNVGRGAENFVEELSKRLSYHHSIDIFSGEDADYFKKVIYGNYDIVIPINGRSQSLKASLGRIIGRYKILITGHSGIGWDDILNVLVRPDVFVALTDGQKKWAKNWAWGSKIIKIPNGIDLDKFSPHGKKINIDLPRPIILSVGALAWYKYHDRVIEAISKLGRGSVLIVGDGPLKEKLIRAGKSLLGSRFKIASFQYEDMPNIYRCADLFTLPSWDREAFGIVYLEAMASGLPVVAPDDLSRREIINGAGILTDVSKSQEYAKALNDCLEKDWKDIPRKQAEKFSWEKVSQMYEEAMLNMLKVK